MTYLNYVNCCKNISHPKCLVSRLSRVFAPSFTGFPFFYRITILPTCPSRNVTSSLISFTPKYWFSLWSLVRSILIFLTVFNSPESLSWVTASSFIMANVLLGKKQIKSILHESLDGAMLHLIKVARKWLNQKKQRLYDNGQTES